jgi:CRP-like cAMP-binding protein
MTESISSDPHNNSSDTSSLLGALNDNDRALVIDRCEKVSLKLGAVLSEALSVPKYIHFPLHGVVSTLARYGDGRVIEMATVGNEGCTGLGIIVGGDHELALQLVQSEGEALALRLADFRRLRTELPSFDAILSNYAQAYIFQILVGAACNGRHTLNERLARWLLQMQDRSRHRKLVITQEILAEMLGVRRQSVTLAAGALQEAGLIAYRRGAIEVLDRPKLEAASCECYTMVRATYERLLPQK